MILKSILGVEGVYTDHSSVFLAFRQLDKDTECRAEQLLTTLISLMPGEAEMFRKREADVSWSILGRLQGEGELNFREA